MIVEKGLQMILLFNYPTLESLLDPHTLTCTHIQVYYIFNYPTCTLESLLDPFSITHTHTHIYIHVCEISQGDTKRDNWGVF